MTTRRKFLSQVLSLTASPLMPVSTGQVFASAAQSIASVAMPAAVLSSMHVDTVAEIAVSAFDVNCVYEISPFPLFENIEDLRGSSLASLEEYFTQARFDTFHPLIDALHELPDDRKGYELDCLAYNIMQIYAGRITQINHILSYSDEHLQALKSEPGFQSIIQAYYDDTDPMGELKAFGAQELSRELIMEELKQVLDLAFSIADKISRMRTPEAGVPVTAAAYMAAVIGWNVETDFFMPERSDDISSAEFARCLKVWMEKEFLKRNQFRLGLYDVPPQVLTELTEKEEGVSSDPVASQDRLSKVGSAIIAEELFGSLEAQQAYFSGRDVDPALCQTIDQLAQSCPGQQTRISWSDIYDPASAHFNVRVAGAGVQMTQNVLEQLKAMFAEAEIRVTEFPSEEGVEGQVFEIAYTDAQGEAESFSQALAEALQQAEREYVQSGPADVDENDLKPENPPIPL